MIQPILLILLLMYCPVYSTTVRSKELFASNIVTEYKLIDQASQADRNKDGVITEMEFANNLYKMADISGNRDDAVSRDELLDYYKKYYNISSDIVTAMFDYLNDPSYPDDVINVRDVSLLALSGKNYISVQEYGDILTKWITQSAEKLFTTLLAPTRMEAGNKRELNYENYIVSVDSNKDGVVTLYEVTQEISRLNTAGPVKRGHWVKGQTQLYQADPEAANLVFDFWDKDGDQTLSPLDIQSVMKVADLNEDGTVKTDELIRFIERSYKLSHRVSGKPVSTVMIQCPDPWWRELGWSVDMDSTRAVMDLDDDMNGWISSEDLTLWLHTFDNNGDSYINREEYTITAMQRYKINVTVASVMFDLSDVNNDDKLDYNDWMQYFQSGQQVSFCDAEFSFQYLFRLAQLFHQYPKGDALKKATRQRLEQELQYYQNNKDVWRNKPLKDLCSGQVSCYVGQVSNDWWSDEAWLWWGAHLSDVTTKPTVSQTSGFYPFTSAPNNMGKPGVPPSGYNVNHLFGGWGQPQWTGDQQDYMRRPGPWDAFLPFKRSNHESFGSPQATHQNPFRGLDVGSQSKSSDDSHSGSKGSFIDLGNPQLNEGLDLRNNPFSSKQNVPSMFNWQPVSRQNQTTGRNDQGIQTDHLHKETNNQSTNERPNLWPYPQPFFYPPFSFGFDPWGAFSFPISPILARIRRVVAEGDNLDGNIRDAERRKREAPQSNGELDDNDDMNSTSETPFFTSWRPNFVIAPPIFSLPPWDPILAWMAERDLWDTLLHDFLEEFKNSTEGTSFNLSDTVWENMFKHTEDLEKQLNSEQKERRQQDVFDSTQDKSSKSREKRFMNSDVWWQSSKSDWLVPRYLPFWQYWQPFFNSWPYYKTPSQEYIFYNQWFPRYFDPNFLKFQSSFSSRVKRKAEEAKPEKDATKIGDRRESPFQEWKNSFTKSNQNVKDGNKVKDDESIWRSNSGKSAENWNRNLKTEDWNDVHNFDSLLINKLLVSAIENSDLNSDYAYARQQPIQSAESKLNFYSSLISNLLANIVWKNIAPIIFKNFFLSHRPDFIDFEPNYFDLVRNVWPDLPFGGGHYPDNNYEPSLREILNRIDDSSYNLNAPFVKREQPKTKPESYKTQENLSNNDESTSGSSQSRTKFSSTRSARRKRWAYERSQHQEWLEFLSSRCGDLEKIEFSRDCQEGNGCLNEQWNRYWSWVCQNTLNTQDKNNPRRFWFETFPYYSNYPYQLGRIKKSSDFFPAYPDYDDQKFRQKSFLWSTNSEQCKEINVELNSHIPWSGWNVLRDTLTFELRQNIASKHTSSKKKMLICSRKDLDNKVFNYITRTLNDVTNHKGDPWRNVDWSRSDVGRQQMSWTKVRKEVLQQATENQNAASSITDKESTTKGHRTKRWVFSDWFPRHIHQNFDWRLTGNSFWSSQRFQNSANFQVPIESNLPFQLNRFFPDRASLALRNPYSWTIGQNWTPGLPERFARKSEEAVEKDSSS